ncbi:MAG TPA: ATP-binding cassette domain-containing protein, partial [Chloroflexota bacterium]|nr:ATP-binding cassette domain-containing protein [Chloroflexota bacterium]
MSREPHLRLHTIKKRFGRQVALHEVSLDLYDGEFVCFLGPSGCGKTTLLRIIAGLEEPDTGHVFHAGRDITRLSPAKRGFGIVFQSYALFPNLTAAQNIAYGLQSRRVPRHERDRRVADLLHMIGLPDVGAKYPAQLSGGQQQRI